MSTCPLTPQMQVLTLWHMLVVDLAQCQAMLQRWRCCCQCAAAASMHLVLCRALLTAATLLMCSCRRYQHRVRQA
jgi:hypothetical protein